MNYKNPVVDEKALSDESGKIATLCLNRPETGNAMNEELMQKCIRLLIRRTPVFWYSEPVINTSVPMLTSTG